MTVLPPKVLTVSSKGQITLPSSVRNTLDIKQGDHLIIHTTGRSILLKQMELPGSHELEHDMNEAHKVVTDGIIG